MAGGSFGGGSGTIGSPYLVEDALDLNAVRNGMSAYYKQTQDIDLSSYANWSPIGYENVAGNRFAGSYDGNKKIISNLTITSSTHDNVGLFGYIYTTIDYTVHSIILRNVNINANRNNVGGISGSCFGINTRNVIVECSVKGDITGLNNIGGILGVFPSTTSAGNSYIKKCNSDCNISGVNSVGGIVGEIDLHASFTSMRLSDCYSSSFISASNNIGGIVGEYVFRASSTNSVILYIERCHAYGNIEGFNYCSGIIGLFNTSTRAYLTISKCYSLHSSIKRTYGDGVNFGRITDRTATTNKTFSDNYANQNMVFQF